MNYENFFLIFKVFWKIKLFKKAKCYRLLKKGKNKKNIKIVFYTTKTIAFRRKMVCWEI